MGFSENEVVYKLNIPVKFLSYYRFMPRILKDQSILRHIIVNFTTI